MTRYRYLALRATATGHVQSSGTSLTGRAAYKIGRQLVGYSCEAVAVSCCQTICVYLKPEQRAPSLPVARSSNAPPDDPKRAHIMIHTIPEPPIAKSPYDPLCPYHPCHALDACTHNEDPMDAPSRDLKNALQEILGSLRSCCHLSSGSGLGGRVARVLCRALRGGGGFLVFMHAFSAAQGTGISPLSQPLRGTC